MISFVISMFRLFVAYLTIQYPESANTGRYAAQPLLAPMTSTSTEARKPQKNARPALAAMRCRIVATLVSLRI